MVVQVETQDRVGLLLKEALPMLCRSGLTDAAEFCVEALIGITVNKSDVFLVSIKETVKSEAAGSEDEGEKSVEVSITKAESQESSPAQRRRQHRKRGRSKATPTTEAPSDSDDGEGGGNAGTTDEYEDSEIKRVKLDWTGSMAEEPNKTDTLGDDNSTIAGFHDSNEAIVIKEEPGQADMSSDYSDLNTSHGYGISGYSQGTALSFPMGASAIGHPTQNQAFPGTSYAQQVLGDAGVQSPGAQGSMAARLAAGSTARGGSEEAQYMCQVPGGGWKCTACTFSSRWKTSVKAHVLAMHMEFKKTCVCGQEFKWHKTLADHRKGCPFAISDQVPLSNIDVLESNKGGPKIAVGGYMYTKRKVLKSGRISWRCVRRTLHCPGALTTGPEMADAQIDQDHNHDPNQNEVEAVKAKQELKRRAADDHQATAALISTTRAATGEEARTLLGSDNSLRRMIRRRRAKKASILLQDVKTLESFSPESGTTFDGSSAKLENQEGGGE